MVLGILIQGGAGRPAEFVTRGDRLRKSAWVKTHLENALPDLPFSFVYGGRASGDLLQAWPKNTETNRIEAARARRAMTWTAPRVGPRSPLHGGRLRRLPRVRMDGVLQEPWEAEHADPGEDPGAGCNTLAWAGNAEGVHPSLLERRHLRLGPLSTARAGAGRQCRRAVRAGRRTRQQRGISVL